MAISLGGAVLVAAMPKLLDYVMGERIARKKKDKEDEEAYRKAVFDDATAARTDRAAFQAMLLARIKELEDEILKHGKPPGSQ